MNTKTPLLSIIIPVYNEETHIKEVLQKIKSAGLGERTHARPNYQTRLNAK